MLKNLCLSILVVIAALLAALYVQDPHVDFRVKLMHHIVQFPFWKCGIYGNGTDFNRACIEGLDGLIPPTGNKVQDGITSKDIFIPFALEQQTGWDGTIRARLFEPVLNSPCKNEKLPLIFFLHGGGFVLASVDQRPYDALGRILAKKTRAFVLSIDYRLAPEHPFPQAIYDVYSAYMWVDQNLGTTDKHNFLSRVDPNKIVVAGDSAGGSFAIITSLLARDGIKYSKDSKPLPAAKHQPKYQVLVYPAVNPDAKTRDMPGAYILDNDRMMFFTSSYIKDLSIHDPNHHHHHLYHHHKADLSGLPPTFVIAAKYDPLAGEDKVFAEQLKQAGVDVTYEEYDSIHGFFSIPFLKEREEVIESIVQKILKNVGDLKC